MALFTCVLIDALGQYLYATSPQKREGISWNHKGGWPFLFHLVTWRVSRHPFQRVSSVKYALCGLQSAEM